jgi:hypothetical protein
MCECVLTSVYAGFLTGIQPKHLAVKARLPPRDMGRFSIFQTCQSVMKLTHPLGAREWACVAPQMAVQGSWCNRRITTVENFEPCTGRRRRAPGYCSFAYSALASFRMGMSGSACFPEGEEILVGGAGLAKRRAQGEDLGGARARAVQDRSSSARLSY